jgi:PAS domain S-box-containing protein
MSDSLLAFGETCASRQGEWVLGLRPPLVDMLPLAAYACDASGKLIWFNRMAADIWGRAPAIGDDAERFCGSHKLFNLGGDLIRREMCPMAEVLRTGVPVSGLETLVVRPDGASVVAMVHIAPLHDEGGNIIGAINCFHDVTGAKQEDRATREREKHIRDLLDALPAAIYTTDAQGRITYYNEAAVELSGRRPTLGRDEWCVTWKLFWPDGTPLPHDQCPMAIALKEDRPVRGAEAVAERPDGSRVPFVPYPTPIHDSAGRLVGAVNMLVDISHRKEAETKQRLLYSELNHRIKNNLQMLHGLLVAAQRETDAPEAKAALADAMQRVGAIATAQKVLYQGDNAAEYSTAAFLSAICAATRQILGAQITIECEAVDERLPNDTAAPLALILNELITNAMKYGAADNGNVRVRVALTREPAAFVLLVEDEGPGFELAAARRRSSGLGLVQGLAGQIGGTFSVERVEGARCTVRFPAPGVQ